MKCWLVYTRIPANSGVAANEGSREDPRAYNAKSRRCHARSRADGRDLPCVARRRLFADMNSRFAESPRVIHSAGGAVSQGREEKEQGSRKWASIDELYYARGIREIRSAAFFKDAARARAGPRSWGSIPLHRASNLYTNQQACHRFTEKLRKFVLNVTL